jgi:hypothetical protein
VSWPSSKTSPHRLGLASGWPVSAIYRSPGLRYGCHEEDLVEVPLQELPPRPVGPAFRQVDDFADLSIELVSVAELGPKTRADEQPVARVHTEVTAIEQGVDVRPEQEAVVEAVLTALSDRTDMRRL